MRLFALPIALQLLVAAAPAQAQTPATPEATDGGLTSGELRGAFSAKEAMVRVARGKVELLGTPRVENGVPVGVSRFDEVRCTLEVKNTLDRAVREVQVEVALARESTGGRPRLAKPGSDDEAADSDTVEVPPAWPIAAWTFHYTLDEIAAGAIAALPCRSTLPRLESADAPNAFAEMTFAVEVTGYRAPGLSLAKAMEMVRRGSPADQRVAFRGYGEGLSDEARARDEAQLAALLGPSPPPANDPSSAKTASPKSAGHHAPPSAHPEIAEPTPLNLALRFSFLLAAAKRIGGDLTLRTLLVGEEPLVARAPPLPEQKDEGHAPPKNVDLLPETFAAAVHETLVEVAHENLAALYLIVHPAPAPVAGEDEKPAHGRHPGERKKHDAHAVEEEKRAQAEAEVVAAAKKFADDEELDAPESWMEAAGEKPAAEGGTRRASRVQVALADAMGRRGGPEVMPVLFGALRSDDEALRVAAARALAARGEPGIANLADALDTEDAARRKPAEDALLQLDGADLETFRALVAKRVGTAAEEGATITDLIAALDAKLAGDRARAVEALLQQADDADPLGPKPLELLSQAKTRSKRAYEAQREHLARIAAHIYVARAAAKRPDARVLLDEVQALGPIKDESFRAAFREARIAEARALAEKDLDKALLLLGEEPSRPNTHGKATQGGFGPSSDPALAEAARALLVARLDDALNRRDTRTGTALLERARRDGVPERELSPRDNRLRLLRLALPLAIAGVVLLLVVGISIPLALRRKRRRAAI